MKLDINCNYDPIQEINDAFKKAGLVSPSEIVMDGQIHRFRANWSKKEDNDSGWYVFYESTDLVSGAFGDWSQDVRYTFHTAGFDNLSTEAQAKRERLVREASEKARKEREAIQEQISKDCAELWSKLPSATTRNGYIARKGLKGSYGARAQGATLVLPLMDKTGKLWSLQSITTDGTKIYHKGGKVKGLFYVIGKGSPDYLCEGYATAVSIHEATGKVVVMAFSAGNLKAVAEQFPRALIVADNDISGTGENKAKEANTQYKMIPEVGMDANDYALKYGLDKLKDFLEPQQKYRCSFLDEWITDVPPRSWILKNEIIKGPALQMLFGQSGCGKTFVNIDRMMRAAALGFKVMYLCGEGIPSAKSRSAVWKQEHPEADIGKNLLICEEEFKLDTSEGIKLIYSIIEQYNFIPDLIVVDTLICFMDGDENDTHAASQFITYCKEVYNKFSCTIVLTHHTGLSDEAQTRARGSSAFKGALDIQDLVTKKGEYITVQQVKNKGGKLVEDKTFRLEDHTIETMFEEDGSNQQCAILVQTEKPKDEELDKRQDLTLTMFQDAGFVFNGEARITRDKARDYFRTQKIEETPQDPNESDAEFEKRISTNVRQFIARLFKDNPLIICVAKDNKGNPTEYACKNVSVNGVMEPIFTMNTVRDKSVT